MTGARAKSTRTYMRTRTPARTPALRGAVQLMLALAVGACAAHASPARQSAAATSKTQQQQLPPSDAEIRDLDINFYKERARRDPTGATDLARLAALYLQRSRDTGDPRDAARAEIAARRSLANRTARNAQAREVLAASLLTQHRFADALAVARALRDENPTVAPVRAMLGEIEMELGQYDSARVVFDGLRGDMNDLSVAPRLARWEEIEGHTATARWLLHRSLTAALQLPSMPAEQKAWFWLRMGDLELRAGRFARADSAYRAGLAVHPNDYRLLAARCRLAGTEHRWRDAIAFGEQAIAANLDPATLGTLSNAYAALGNRERSAEYARVLDVAVLRQPGAYHRAWSLYLLDHDRHLATVDRKIRWELRTRRDIYGYDLLAWSLHKRHHDAEAAEAMRLALHEGTQDALLFRHAAAIEAGLGHRDAASRLAARAAALDPALSPASDGAQ